MFMRIGRQVCEGCDDETRRPCLSRAQWKVALDFDVEVYLCSTYALSGFAEPWGDSFRTEFSETGWETQPGHEAATLRYKRIFAREFKDPQLDLF